jgi:biopolymer transport protein ExbD
MSTRAKKPTEEGEVEANLLPVMNVMFLLIPALLLAMEVARFSAVTVTPPTFSELSDASKPPTTEPLRLRVHVRQDGFTARYGSSPKSERSIDIPLGTDGKHDYPALEQRAAELKALFPEDDVVNISAEGSVDYSTLVQSLDALRGHECSLQAAQLGEQEPEGCYFWSAVVQSTTV